jgi:4-hydroxybenzoate polyprenyltransferase
LLADLLKTMRPKQWLKNVFVFAPLVFDIKLTDLSYLARAVVGFLLLCLASGTIYIINDVADREKDRHHPRKRDRPIASGRLPLPVAVAAAAILLLVTLPVSFLLDREFSALVLLYVLLQLAYSFWLKKLVIVDVMAIASGFVLRVAAGVPLVAAERFSPWMYTCMALLALFIGFNKRRNELSLLRENAGTHRRNLQEYTLPLLDQMIGIVTAATLVCYTLYTALAENLPPNYAMMLSIPFVLYSMLRWLYLVHVKGMGGEPEEVLLKDRPLQAGVLLWGASVVLIMYVFR